MYRSGNSGKVQTVYQPDLAAERIHYGSFRLCRVVLGSRMDGLRSLCLVFDSYVSGVRALALPTCRDLWINAPSRNMSGEWQGEA